jgi:hypothetical protein
MRRASAYGNHGVRIDLSRNRALQQLHANHQSSATLAPQQRPF